MGLETQRDLKDKDHRTLIAQYISVIGHPFLTIPVFVIVILFRYEDAFKASLLSLLIIGGVFLPLAFRTYQGVKRGNYTNLDISDQRQRQRWFYLPILLIFLLLVFLWVTGQNHFLRYGATCAWMLLVVSQLLNKRVKASMHMAYYVFLGLLIFAVGTLPGIVFLLFAPLLAWSRLYLRRHVRVEIVAGVTLGAFFGVLFLYLNAL